MGPDHGSKVAKPKKPLYRHALVDQAVVDDDVRDSERAHPDADAERDLAGDPRGAAASEENERDGDRRVKERQGVVGFEARPVGSRLVVRSMNSPKPRVPDPAVKQRRPEVHRHGDDDGNRRPHDRMNEERAHRDALPRAA